MPVGRARRAGDGRSIHEISKRDVIEVISAVEQRGAPPVAANKTLEAIKTFLRWCAGRVLDLSPAEGIPLPAKEVAGDRVLSDDEFARVIIAAGRLAAPMAESSNC